MNLIKTAIAVFTCTSFLFAQGVGTDKTPKADSVMRIHGKVVSVNVAANILILQTRRTEDTLHVESGAKIMLGMMELSKEVTFDDIYVDDNVTVTWKMIEGKKTAIKIVDESVFDSRKPGP
jgi:hypothetical protein